MSLRELRIGRCGDSLHLRRIRFRLPSLPGLGLRLRPRDLHVLDDLTLHREGLGRWY
jgi:hypothetical protein